MHWKLDVMPCVDCGEEVAQTDGPGRPRIRCEECRKVGYRRLVRRCPTCGDPAEKGRTYCVSHVEVHGPRVCLCGRPPAPPTWYCSDECREMGRQVGLFRSAARARILYALRKVGRT